MSIEIAKNAGFCFGVSRAFNGILKLASEKKGRIYTVGELIHNRIALEELEECGIFSVDENELESIASSATEESPVTMVIRTHGITLELENLLEECRKKYGFFDTVDFTCPYVKKIQRLAETGSGKRFVLFGDPAHPEVQGIISRAGEKRLVISDADDVPEGDDFPTVIASQTTANTEKWKKAQKKLKKVFTSNFIFDTICRVTDNRQAEAAELAKRCDLMLVIGSRQSSNTCKLFEISKKHCENTLLIESPEDLPIKSSIFRNVGITAGASTPSRLIQEVYKQMSEIIKEVENTEDFAAMLEESWKTLNTGDIVKGIVVAVSGTELHVDLVGTKFTGIISAENAVADKSADLAELFKIGDEIEAKVIKVSDRDGVAELSKKSVDMSNKWKKFIGAYESGETLEGKVVKICKKRDSDVQTGVEIQYEDQRIFVPASQTGIAKEGDLSELKDTDVRFKVIDIDEGKKRAMASIRKAASEERKALRAKFWDEIEEGKHYTGEVKSLTSYGAFVDLGGVDGMVHASELSWTHIKSPADVVSVGDTIDVFVKSFDKEKKRISLGYKTEETNPWNIFKANYAVGDIVNVKIVSIMPFGAFAEIMTGIDGLIHISQVADHKVNTPADVLKVGDSVNAAITGIDDDKKQVALSIRVLLEGAKTEAPAAEEEEEAPADEEPAVYSSDDENVDAPADAE